MRKPTDMLSVQNICRAYKLSVFHLETSDKLPDKILLLAFWFNSMNCIFFICKDGDKIKREKLQHFYYLLNNLIKSLIQCSYRFIFFDV